MKSKRGYIAPRGKEKRKRNPILLYVAEGNNKTEFLYLKALGQRYIKTKIIQADGNETDPVKMINQLKRQSKELELSSKYGDRAYCLIDTDVDRSKQTQIDAACAKQDNLTEVILSSPCFEIWFLCHCRYSTKYLTSDEAMGELKKYYPGHQKNKSIFAEIEAETAKAIANAKRLKCYHDDLGRGKYSMDRNPSTDMYKVVEFITNH